MLNPLQPFSGINVAPPEATPIRRRYSVTGDIVGFRQCARRYGAFRVHNYAPAHQTQLYFGTIVHQVLDRCHAHYHGVIDPATRGQVPDGGRVLSNEEVAAHFDEIRDARQANDPVPAPPTDLVRFFLEVETGLKSRGIHAITPDLRLRAIRVLQYFNRLEGETLYGRVVDTEHRLQADRGDHILHGVVDLLVAGEPPDEQEELEIWDYKGTSRLSMTADDLRTYQFQMRVYAHLYELKHGARPRRVVLYLLNELDGDTPPDTRPVNATIELSLEGGLSAAEIDEAMGAFDETRRAIEASREADEWPPAPPGTISPQSCAICDKRWDCPTPNETTEGGVAMRYP